jgi:uncharacterized protein
MSNTVVHFEILGPDGAALQRFYAGLFGWKIDADNPMSYGLVGANGGQVSGGIAGSQDGKPFASFYVKVDDLQATLDAAGEAGGRTVVPPTEIPNMVTFAQFADPAGNVIGLVQG